MKTPALDRALAPRRALALALALALSLPIAGAYPNHAYPCDVNSADGVCVGEVAYGECGQEGQTDAVTGAAVKLDGQYWADVGGFALCDTTPAGQRQVHGVYVETRYVTFAWAEESCEGETYCEAEGCSWWLYYPGAYQRIGCSEPPPNPGWGRILS